MQRATTLDGIMKALAPAPLSRDELPEFFEETAEARDPNLPRRVEIAQCLSGDDNTKILVYGHPGTGKSTELVKFQQENDKDYATVSFSLIKEAQLSQASIEVLLVLIVESILRQGHEQLGLSMKEDTLKAIYGWFSEAFDIREEDLKYTGEIGASADTGTTFWGKLLGVGVHLKADIKTGSNTIHRCITKENKRLSELANQCNVLVREARIAIKKQLGRELLLIVEDLDKVTILAADEIFLQNPAPLSDLACKAIFTAPIALMCTPRSSALDAEFKKVSIPMIKVAEQDGLRCDRGIAAIRAILDHRLDVDSLIEAKALTLAIEKTAGVLRHLFDVLTTASQAASHAASAGGRKEKRITERDVRYGLDRLRGDLVRRIGVVGLPAEYKEYDITVEKMYQRLREILEKRRTVQSDPINLLLLQSQALIEYNGKNWHAVHPLIEEYLRETQ